LLSALTAVLSTVLNVYLCAQKGILLVLPVAAPGQINAICLMYRSQNVQKYKSIQGVTNGCRKRSEESMI
jgi:hypothetical protein